MNYEPQPGERIAPDDFDQVVRLTPLVSIDMVIRSADGRVLVGRRKFEPARGLFFVPGGRITKNETVAAAFRRISRVELGVELQFSKARLLGVYDHLYKTNNHERPGFGTHYVTLGYEVKWELEQPPVPDNQHGELEWWTPAELLASAEVHENTKAYFKPKL